MNRILSLFSGVRARIILLAFLGILGMVFITAVNGRLDGQRRISQENILLVLRASTEIQTLGGMEKDYINSRRRALLENIEAAARGLEGTVSQAAALPHDDLVDDLIATLDNAIDKRVQLFQGTVEALSAMDKARADLTVSLAGFNEAFLEIVKAIDQEERDISLTGDMVSQSKDSVRKEVKELLGYGNETRLNLMENLLYLGDREKYSAEKQKLDKRLKVSLENVRLSVVAENSEVYNKWWDKGRNILPQTIEFEKTALDRWLAARDLVARLNQAAEEAQKLAVEIVSVVTENGRRLDRNGALVSLSAAGLGLLLLISLGAAIYLAVSKPLAKTMDLAGAVGRGDLDVRLNLKSRDEFGRLAGALDSMTDNLRAKADLAETIASGDLTQEIVLASEKDLLGRSLMNMRDNLNQVLLNVSGSASLVDSEACQVSDSSQSLSQGATEQASALEEITSSLMELSAQTKSNAENAAQANRLSLRARDMAENGVAQMSEMISAMAEINQASKEIAKIIKTIDDIAFQTNLLALNAAVEAARAGKHGKGFAVVAQEVRNLAGKSAKAAGETEELIARSARKTEDGVKVVNVASAAFNEIAAEISRITDLAGEIAAAGSEQAQGLSQINQGLKQVEEVTHRNTAGAEQTAAAAEELSQQSNRLKALLAGFRLKRLDQPFEAARPGAVKSLPGPSKTQGPAEERPNSHPALIPLDNR
ncbi:MAG: methyl-accepting chemotaxis protein [Pseudomonadota bacterium]